MSVGSKTKALLREVNNSTFIFDTEPRNVDETLEDEY